VETWSLATKRERERESESVKQFPRELISGSIDFNVSIDACRIDGDTYTAMVAENVSQLSLWAPPQEGASIMEALGPGGRERCEAAILSKNRRKT
jgi:hypothetical protein